MNRISLCVIARDEEATLPRMLASARDAVDEIVVVDTGSSDRTMEVAGAAGATVLRQPFADDFAAARNAGLAAARHPWILVLDADEQLAPGAARAIRGAAADQRLAGAYLTFRNDLGGGREHVCGILRLFRNDPSIRFRFRIHEQVVESVEDLARREGLRLATLRDAVVLHDGYRPEVRDARRKDERNERLFRLQLQDRPDCAYSWYKFGDFLRRFEERRDEALAALERSAAILQLVDPARVRHLAYAAEVSALLALETDAAGNASRALRIAEDGRTRYAASPNLCYVLAYLYARAARHREAFRCYAQLRSFEGRVLAVPPEPGATGTAAFLGMGLSLVQLGHCNAARRCLEHAIARDASSVKAHLALARLQVSAGALEDAMLCYRGALAAEPGRFDVRLRLAALLVHNGRGSEAEAEYRAAQRAGAAIEHVATGLGAARLQQGDFEGAYASLSQVPEDRDARTGMDLLERVAAGVNPWTEDTFATGAGRRWLRHLEHSLNCPT